MIISFASHWYSITSSIFIDLMVVVGIIFTLLLMFDEKGDCISFSLDTDDKIDKINQSKHHKLKQVYFPDSYLLHETHEIDLSFMFW